MIIVIIHTPAKEEERRIINAKIKKYDSSFNQRYSIGCSGTDQRFENDLVD